MSAKKKEPDRKSPREFASEEEEREFWAVHDVVDYFDWDRATVGSFPALKPSIKTISLRLPESLLEELKTLANEQDVPYQSLLKMYLAERVAREREGRRRKPA
jgi:predicted DNA binding CopG/RHH family protein